MTNRKEPEIRVPGFEDEWEERKVFQIAKDTYGGGTPKTSVKEFWNGDIPWIQSSDLETNRLFNVSPKKKITPEAVQKSATKIIPPNSIAIVTRVGVGKLALMSFEYATSQDFLSLSKLQVDSYFGSYSLYTMLQKELSNIQGTSIKGMTKSDLLEKKLMVPKNAEEQEKIGTFFKQLDDTIALHQQELSTLKQTKQGFLQKMFPKEGEKVPELRFPGFTDDWEQRKLGELLNEVKRPLKISDDEKYQLVTVKRRNGGVVSRGFFKGKDILVKNYFELRLGDYLISKRQVVHGANGIVPNNLDGAVVSNEYLVSIGNENITTDFLKIISTLPQMYKMFFLSSYGIDIEKLVFNIEDWKKREMRIPSLEEQKRIYKFFNKLDNTITLHQRELELLQATKKAFLQKMFV